ncbi:1,3-beta-galactosyl-N-acetylhexosamine phosphorylase [Paenibacillus aceti]|uniref:1,3-beta-galactosyl-N-acetylhexosamine phosphorylase n=1 Tax=Paenibacillus aceti TaxID=1820010 RepID=A0ABQ1W3N9_9BACL|nr:1,3-beta-galactosyl-N-acetylhexosamine phosphorylase [Paenibacillus aceti]GGG12157.1 1,3-beta-galactosyl-N-acetylhexosamine phosphorylase [Paenibacillus aceti]
MSEQNQNKPTRGRLTIPTDLDVVGETLKTMELWGADAVRDADGTTFPQELVDCGAKIYATYYTTRKDNNWAKANPDEVQQCYISTRFVAATDATLSIRLLEGISEDLLQVNNRDDIYRWWEVIDRTTGEVVPTNNWSYDEASGSVIINNTIPYHEYSVSFLTYLIWDPVHMYNAVVNDWKDFERQITFDVRQPKTREYSKGRLREFLREKSYVNVVRFTTFFHQFTLVFDELRREKYVDWYGYSASVSPYILEQFEREVGYKFRPEFIIDEGYYNNQYRIPSKEYLDFMAFQRREVAQLAKELVDITHEEGREAMMFLGDHFIGTEPYMDEFKTIGLDAVVGSVGNGSTLRLISDIPGVKYTEGRFLPYFFPDTFHPGGNPTAEAQENWLTARRAILRKPVDRIGYGGYLKLALDFPDFVDYVTQVADEFRDLYEKARTKPLCLAKVAVLNCWGKMRSWGCHMVHHALYQKQNYSYAGIIEILSGAPFDVSFISFDDIREQPQLLEDLDVIINIGDADTAHTGGENWKDPFIVEQIRAFIARGGGFIGVGEPSAVQHQGRFFQLGDALGVELERGFTLGYDKYNWDVKPSHFITADMDGEINFGEGKKNIYATSADILACDDKEVQFAVNNYFDGRSVYIGGLPYSAENARLLHRAILWSCGKDTELHNWFSSDAHTEIHVYPETGTYCVVNNTAEPRNTTVYANGKSFELELKGGELRWFNM